MHTNWQKEEQNLLKRLAEKNMGQPIDWNNIAHRLNNDFSGKLFTGNQCREKYLNHLKFDNKRAVPTPWTNDEFKTLLQKYEEIGSHWTIIQKQFPERSQNCLKNKFYGELRKLIRQLNNFRKKGAHKTSKQIKYESLMRIFQGAEGIIEFKGELGAKSKDLKRKIMGLLLNTPSFEDEEALAEIIQEIHQFNMETRCYCAKKIRKKGVEKAQGGGEVVGEGVGEEKMRMKRVEKLKRRRDKDDKNEQCPKKREEDLKGQEESNEFPEMMDLSEYPEMEESSERCASDLEEEVSNILGQQYTPMGFQYFEGREFPEKN